MDDDQAPPEAPQLIAALCLEAGRIMEDASSDLALSPPGDERAIGSHLLNARAAAEDILAMLAAAQALHRRSARPD